MTIGRGGGAIALIVNNIRAELSEGFKVNSEIIVGDVRRFVGQESLYNVLLNKIIREIRKCRGDTKSCKGNEITVRTCEHRDSLLDSIIFLGGNVLSRVSPMCK